MKPVHDPVVIVSVSRTPLGGFLGSLSSVTAPQLGASAIAAAVQRAGIQVADVDEVFIGCVLSAGLGQAPARQAALGAGLPYSVPCTTVSKVCGSGMKAVMLGHDALVAGSAGIVVAGGMESMSNAPYLLSRARSGYRLGHDRVIDHMFLDGLEDAYEDRGTLMGIFAEQCADEYGFTRDAQDAWALRSLLRAREADASGAFEWEITPVTVAANTRGDQPVSVSSDEQPQSAKPEKIKLLKPAFRKDGTVTAANSSSISDGAAAMVMMRASRASALGLKPLAAIAAHASYAGEPRRFPMAPAFSVRMALERCNWKISDVDVFEINEAFAVVTLAAIRDLGLDPDQVNPHGGACALGHPIGATGARLIATLIGALRRAGGRRGVASLCIGGGEATAVALELWQE